MKKWIIILIITVGAFIFLQYLLMVISNKNKDGESTMNNPITTNHQITKTFSMLLASPSFKNGEFIPKKFTCDGGNINPELQIQNVPAEAKSLALIMDDPDATRGRTFTHWLVWNIDPKTAVIKEESVPPGSVEGTNDFPRLGYGGPCPPRGSKPHHYHFKLFALDAILDLKSGENKSALEAEINKHLIANAELVGLYQR